MKPFTKTLWKIAAYTVLGVLLVVVVMVLAEQWRTW